MSIEAIRAVTAQVHDQAVSTHQQVFVARERLGEALRTLTDLSRNHSTSLVPPELRRADEQLAECLGSLAGSLACLDRFVAGL